MERSKSYALLFLLGAFVAGAAVGVAGDRTLERRAGPSRRAGVDRMAQELGLTAPQRAAFDSILENRRTQMRQLFAPIRPQLDSLTALSDKMRDSTHEQLKRVLTPEQQVKFDKMHEEAKRRAADARRRFDMNAGPGSRGPGPGKR